VFKLIALHLSRELIVLILTSNCLRKYYRWDWILLFTFIVISACAPSPRPEAMTRAFYRSFLASRVLFFSASDQLLATETLSRARLSCKYAEKAEEVRVRVIVCIRASTDSLASAARKRGGAYARSPHVLRSDSREFTLLRYAASGACRAIDSGAPPWATCLWHDTENREEAILSADL